MHNILASVFYEHSEGTGHLTISNECVFLHVVVPHLHEVLLTPVDVRKVVDHLAGLDPQPLWVGVILLVLPMQDRVRWDRQTCGAEKLVFLRANES